MDNYVGKRLDGRYEIQEIIGVGGMAVVYKAYDSIDDRVVAVKILKDEYLANEEFRRRFKNESKAIAVLSHPNIVKVYDVSYGDKLQYIVMEYIEGITLKEYIEQVGTVNWKEAVHFVTQILRALQHAHDKGIVHRDIKPQNIMLVQNGNIKVADFGIARFSRSETRTMSGSAIGSVHYISPEQARGDITDDKADIYSVGVVMYEMLTGQVPFQSENSVSVAIMQLQTEPKNPREINKSIPIGLEQIIMRAMQKNTRDRYQSAAEMLLDLEEFKRNPAVKFEYNHFIDNDPTKFIGSSVIQNHLPVNEVNENNDEDGKQIRSSLFPVMIGVAGGLLALIIIITGIFFLSNYLSGDKIEVPNFIGMNYNSGIKNNKEYDDFLIKTESESSELSDGTVISQSPEKGKKIDKGGTVILTIAAGKTVGIPDVNNLSLPQAKKTLENLGFVVDAIPEVDMTVDDGTVLRTSPEQGEQATRGSTVTVYYASENNLEKVPNLIGWGTADAERLLTSVHLVLDENIISEDSVKPAGEIIKQSYDEGLKVPLGTKISVTISTGIPPESTAEIKIKLPNYAARIGNVLASLNSEIVYDKNVLLDGSNYTFKVNGSGKENTLKVLVDSVLNYECTIDFTKVPGVLSNIKDYSSSNITVPTSSSSTENPISKVKMPQVVGLSQNDAINELINAGFMGENIMVIDEVVSDLSKVGRVIRQNPEYNVFSKYSTDSLITLNVGVAEYASTASAAG